MALNRSALRKTSSSELLQKVQKDTASKKTDYDDDRMWKPTRDENDNWYAVVKLLPSPVEDGRPVVEMYSHFFKYNGKWYIEECPTSVGKKCPVCDHNVQLWNSGLDSDKETARNRSRSTSYLCNVLIVKDPKKPANEGKVFMWPMGKKLYQKALAVLNPPEEFGETSKNPWAFFDSVELKLRVKKGSNGFINYDDSAFVPCEDLLGGDEDKLEELLTKCYDLEKILQEKNSKSYEELARRFSFVLGLSDGNSVGGAAPSENVTIKEAPKPQEAPAEPKESSSGDSTEDLMNYFKNLQQGAEEAPF